MQRREIADSAAPDMGEEGEVSGRFPSVEVPGAETTAASPGERPLTGRKTAGASEAERGESDARVDWMEPVEEEGARMDQGEPAGTESEEELIGKLFTALSDAFQKVGRNQIW